MFTRAAGSPPLVYTVQERSSGQVLSYSCRKFSAFSAKRRLAVHSPQHCVHSSLSSNLNQSRHHGGALVGLAPQIETWNTKQVELWLISLCQAPPAQTQSPLLITFWRRFWSKPLGYRTITRKCLIETSGLTMCLVEIDSLIKSICWLLWLRHRCEDYLLGNALLRQRDRNKNT